MNRYKKTGSNSANGHCFDRNFGIACSVLKVIIAGLFGVSARTHLLFVYNSFFKRKLCNNHGRSQVSCNKIAFVSVISCG
jgi:hypothetical protein